MAARSPRPPRAVLSYRGTDTTRARALDSDGDVFAASPSFVASINRVDRPQRAQGVHRQRHVVRPRVPPVPQERVSRVRRRERLLLGAGEVGVVDGRARRGYAAPREEKRQRGDERGLAAPLRRGEPDAQRARGRLFLRECFVPVPLEPAGAPQVRGDVVAVHARRGGGRQVFGIEAQKHAERLREVRPRLRGRVRQGRGVQAELGEQRAALHVRANGGDVLRGRGGRRVELGVGFEATGGDSRSHRPRHVGCRVRCRSAPCLSSRASKGDRATAGASSRGRDACGVARAETRRVVADVTRMSDCEADDSRQSLFREWTDLSERRKILRTIQSLVSLIHALQTARSRAG